MFDTNRCFAAGALSLLTVFSAAAKPANSIELEWNSRNNTSFPYEVAIDRAKLDKLAGIPQGNTLQAVAVTPDGEKELDTQLISGNAAGKEILRFTVPAGTDKLYAVVKDAPKKAVCVNTSDNLFDGALKSAAKWKKSRNSIKITSKDNKITIEVKSFGGSNVKYFADLPAGYAGTPAALDIELTSKAKLTWGGGIKVEQYDAKGKLLPESLTEPRWISHMRIPGVTTRYQEYGFFHKDAKRIAVVFEFTASKFQYDNHGIALKNHNDGLPKMEISKLAVRQAQELPFPSYNNKLFAKGASGQNGDTALVLDGKTVFHFSPNTHAVYSEHKQVKSDKECFFPLNDATVELWVNPQWKKSERKKFVILDARNNYGPRAKNKAIRKRIDSLFLATYAPARGAWEVSVYDGTNQHHKFKFNHKLELKKWSHIAIQYGSSGIECFVNGKKVFENKEFSFTERTIDSKFMHNDQIAQLVSLGNDGKVARGVIKNFAPAMVDALRISGGKRYDDEFTPEINPELDGSTYALFDFNRSIDGKSANGLGKIYGSINAPQNFLRERTFSYNGRKIQYFPAKLIDKNNPYKVLNKLNYPVVPSVADFKAARKDNVVKYSAKNGSHQELSIPANTFMNYIEISCPDNVPELRHPVVIANDELDTRSFGDIAESLRNFKGSDYEKVNRLFNLVLGASDYFMTHQATITAHSNKSRHASYQALTLFNSYCGFECGPLNNMAANMLSCAGLLPATQTSGYGHSFQQVFFDGKNHVYDLSAQQFFPSPDNETPASLKELDRENGAFERWDRNSSSFVRQGATRGYSKHVPGMQKRIAYTLHPGEKARFYFYNDGNYNDIQVARCIDPRAVHPNDPFPYDRNFRLARKAPAETVCTEQLYQVYRPFPHYSNAYFTFSGKPSKNNRAFSKITDDDFVYAVELPYPIVAGKYQAVTTDGKMADIEISTDGGETYRKLVTEADGRAVYAIRARHAYYIKVKAPIDKVAKFDAYTEVMFNSRIQNCKLKAGNNTLLFKAENGKAADITVSYRSNVKDIIIKDAPYNGAIPGFERQITAVEPGRSVVHTVSGISDSAKVIPTDGITAKLEDGKLFITAKSSVKAPRIDNVIIDDNGAKKELDVIVMKNIRLSLAKNAQTTGNAKVVAANSDRIQSCAFLKETNQKAVFGFNEIPAGDYTVWVLSRMDSLATRARSQRTGKGQDLALVLPDGSEVGTMAGINSGTEFYKAKYGQPGGKGRFRWDARLDNDHNKYPYFSPRWTTLEKCSSVTLRATRPQNVEVAAVLITPRSCNAFRCELVKLLCGLNYEPRKIAEQQK